MYGLRKRALRSWPEHLRKSLFSIFELADLHRLVHHFYLVDNISSAFLLLPEQDGFE